MFFFLENYLQRKKILYSLVFHSQRDISFTNVSLNFVFHFNDSETFLDRESKKSRFVGHVDQLFIYPLKSGVGIDIPFAHAAEQFRILRNR